MVECTWMNDEICVNAACPMVADFCPVPNIEGVCRYENRGNDEVLVDDGEECQLYTLERGGVPIAYRYGPEWVAQQLFMEGGYPTPEEAKEAWYRERSAE